MNLRPSGYEPDELPGCSIPRQKVYGNIEERYVSGGLVRFGDDLLSHVLRRSTIGAKALNGQVRDGAGCFALAMITKPNKSSRLPFGASKSCTLSMCMLLIDEWKSSFYWIKSSLSSH